MTTYEPSFNMNVTTINTEKYYKLDWQIQNYSKTPGVLDSFKFALVPGYPKIWIARFMMAEDRGSFGIGLVREEDGVGPVRIKYSLDILDVNSEKVNTGETGEVSYPGPGIGILLKKCENMSLPQCYLRLNVTMAVYGYDVQTNTSYIDTTELDLDAQEFRNNYQNLMEDDKTADLTIHVGNASYSAHKFIIRYRAPKLSEGFMHDYFKVNSITIKDIDGQVFKSVLRYIYTGEVIDAQLQSKALELYRAAHKCGLNNMRRKCGKSLVDQFCVGNVCEVFTMAKEYGDEELKKAASIFMLANLEEMMDSLKFKELEDEELKKAAHTFMFANQEKMNN